MMITQRVENSRWPTPRWLLTTVVQVAYGTDLDALMPAAGGGRGAGAAGAGRPGAGVQLGLCRRRPGADVAFWIDDPENGQGNVRSDVNLAVLRS
jgi:hypothetical protein